MKPQLYVFCMISCAIWGAVLLRDFRLRQNDLLLIVFVSVFVLLIVVAMFFIKLMTEKLENTDLSKYEKNLKVFQTGIELNGKSFLYSQITKITYQRVANTQKVILNTENGETITHRLRFNAYEMKKPLFLALGWVAQFVEINFKTSDQREYSFIKSIEQNYAGRILVLE